MRCLTFVAAALALTSCAQWSTETKVEEGAFQFVHAVDVAQTLATANHRGCYYEQGDVYELYGEHPSRTQVMAWGVGYAALHAGVTHLIERYESTRWPQRIWQAITIGATLDSVYHNWQIGLRFDYATGPNHDKCDPKADPAQPAEPPPPAASPPPTRNPRHHEAGPRF